jgi:tetratricopeptide (TPR) repeat protein
MLDLLRPLLLLFYAPARGMSEVRDRAPLVPAMLLALATQFAYTLVTQWLLSGMFVGRVGVQLVPTLIRSAGTLMLVGVVLIPVMAFIANLFDRRGSFSFVLQQEYAPLASTVFYALAVTNLLAMPLVLLASAGGLPALYVAQMTNSLREVQEQATLTPELKAQLAQMAHPRLLVEVFFIWIKLILFAGWSTIALREVFRLTLLRTLVVLIASAVLIFITSPVWGFLFTSVFGSPFLLIILFFLLRGYFGEVMKTQRARASFKQNLEAATLNPADASAHYNLGLIQQQRGELNEARGRFERAVEIDADELDAHFQLGRIARTQNRLAEAIAHFEQVVARDETHAQHEIWREIGATYLAAGQFDDARDTLRRFLEHRQSDPEALYLMGRTLEGLGRGREAADSMQACIEAVKTSPAYKYRTEKRWLNEAQQFLRSKA